MHELSKVVIPVAGLGTRVLPACKVIPKELLTVVDKPLIQHVVEEAVAAGFKDIILVSRSGKSAIIDHFDSNYELEAELARKEKFEMLESVKDLLPIGVSICSVRQSQPLGLGHAVLCAASAIGNGNNFAVMLPDVLIHNGATQSESDFTHMASTFTNTGIAQIMVEGVPYDQVEKYGIVDCDGKKLNPGDSQNIKAMVEKPARDLAPSNQSIVGRYILPYRVLQILQSTQPGVGGEIQLTDALDLLITEVPVQAYSMRGKTYDCGSKLGFLKANIAFGLNHPETKDGLEVFLQQTLTR